MTVSSAAAAAFFSSSSLAILRSTALSFFCASRSERPLALRWRRRRGGGHVAGRGDGVRRAEAGVDFLLHAVDVVVVAGRVADDAAAADFDDVRRHAVHEVPVVAGEDHRALVAA